MHALLLAFAVPAAARPWMDTSLTPDQRAEKLVAQMTSDEMIQLMGGTAGDYVGNVPAIPSLGIPAQKSNDGPQGFRVIASGTAGTSTAFPAALTVAASFDADVATEWGAAMGEEFYGKGANIQLGPGMCMARLPQNGRNFEYVAGEDPVLGREMAYSTVKAIQSKDVIANAKHWVANSQETGRTTYSMNVDERTRYEIYYPAFEGAVAAGVLSVMCSYNKIHDVWSCENHETLQHDLKDVIGFKGYVMSDWGATHSVSVLQGLDQEMPGTTFFGDRLKADFQNGTVPLAALQNSAKRILRALFAVGEFDRPNPNTPAANVTSEAHNQVAKDIAAKGAVLLKNDDGALPFDTQKVKTIAVIGDQCAAPIVAGGGSGAVVPSRVVTPLAGVQVAAAAAGATVTYNDGSNTVDAAAAAAAADVALVCVATTSSEGGDRGNLNFGTGDALVAAVAAKQANTVVAAVAPGACLTPWRDAVKAVLMFFLPGQEYGTALAELLFGAAAPSGRLPITLPNVENEVNFTKNQWPGVGGEVEYSEGLLVGYRWYTAKGVKPAYPFGHGLTYTTFSYSNLKVDGRKVTFTVANTGARAGVETPQVYVTLPAATASPPLQLKYFAKVSLAAGASQDVSYTLTDRDVSYYSADKHAWVQAEGVRVGVGPHVDAVQHAGVARN
eukprot:TRINITY_DN713_c6_g1_i1.p1 TRINITY_DN713_c6_g1~~TRINITY_DN713_c6_g1_i1.p1  ORF type:complete len:670 (+),score=265.77 TRINITY_DN713_c6_g1_i1:37-2046(+)